MAALTVYTVADAGVTPTFVTAGASGDTFPCDGKTFLVVKNASGGTITVTKTTKAASRPGAAAADETVSITTGSEKWIKFDPTGFADMVAGGVAKATCSSTSSVTVAAIRN